jgi:hypothetical protein
MVKKPIFLMLATQDAQKKFQEAVASTKNFLAQKCVSGIIFLSGYTARFLKLFFIFMRIQMIFSGKNYFTSSIQLKNIFLDGKMINFSFLKFLDGVLIFLFPGVTTPVLKNFLRPASTSEKFKNFKLQEVA